MRMEQRLIRLKQTYVLVKRPLRLNFFWEEPERLLLVIQKQNTIFFDRIRDEYQEKSRYNRNMLV